MAQLFQNQLQPFEENQSPSPTHEHPDPFNLSRSRSSSSRTSNNPADSPSSPINTLHRQLSGDPDAPPPAWKRRASFTQKSPNSAPDGNGAARSLSQTRAPKVSPTGELISPSRPSQPPPSASARRHPALQMTTTTRPPIPSGLYTHDPSPNASSTSLYDPTFAPPQPAFLRKRGEGGSRSNRSSIHSMDTSGMTSENLWNLESSESVADLSNPQRNAMERPLDTIRRLSMRSERGTPAVSPYSPSALPVDFLWPVAPLVEEPPMQMRRMKAKSTTNVPGLAQRQSRLGRRKTSRQTSADPQMIGKIIDDTPSADMPRSNSVFISSAHSSATDLSKGMPGNKSMTSLGSRPPSAYYSRDFLSQLAPREGGYAIAAMLSSPAVPGQMSAEERRRSTNLEAARVSRPPTSKSAGMGRWSLDGGEHYNRPYGSASANTTSSNLSAPPINSPDPSPPADEITHAPMLPEGASPAVNSRNDTVEAIPVSLAVSSSAVPTNPSPLSQSVIEAPPTPALDTASIPVPPIPSSSIPTPAGPTLSPKKSKKQLAKEAKVQEKAEAAKILAARAAKAKEDAAKRQAEKDAMKKKEKEEKERKKMEKKLNKGGNGLGLKSTRQPTLETKGPRVEPIPVPSPAPVVMPSTASTGTSNTAVSSSSTPNTIGKQQPSTTIPLASGERRNVSMPAGTLLHSSKAEAKGDQPKKTKLGLFGTIRKRFSTMDTSSKASLGKTATGRSPIQLDEPPKPTPTVGSSALALNPEADTPGRHDTLSAASQTAPATTVYKPEGDELPRPPAPAMSVQRSIPNEVVNVLQPEEGLASTTRSVQPVPIQQSEDLPLRTSSIHHSSPSPSRTPQPPLSSDSHSSPSAGLRSRNSIQGPRPMPRSGSISSRTHSPPMKPASSVPTGETTGLSQVQSHLTSTSSSGTYDSQTPMTSEEEEQEQRLGQGEKMSRENGAAGRREVAGLDLGRVVAAH